ncbi:hypothetical protein TNCV_3034111 [Trichonephila clavipes]|nr:hypothetical protein TNCV_3034111 [Trichonephila clavipes]
MLKRSRFDILELQETKTPKHLINTTNERRLVPIFCEEEDSLATAPVQVQSISPLIFRSTGLDSSGSKGLRCGCKMHVWVSGPTKMPTALDVRRSDVTT